MLYFDGFQTPIGRIHVVVDNAKIVRLYLPNTSWTECYIRDTKHPLIREAKKQLQEYFKGTRRNFDLPVKLFGTKFQLDAWRILQKIPYGSTISYSEQASRMLSPRALRAVGNANRNNPIPIIVPCHRVIAKDGSLGGYVAGSKVKKKLLALEKTF